MPGTAYVLFHHVMGETERQARRLGLRQGRHGRDDAARWPRPRATSAPRSAATPRWRASSCATARSPASSWRTATSSTPRSSPATPTATSRSSSCSTEGAAAGLPRRRRRASATTSASLKINVRPRASCRTSRACPGTSAGPQHRGTIHLCPDQDYIERAYDDAKYGRPSRTPVLECTHALGRSIRRVAPPGKHLMSMFVQYAPYKLRDGTWDDAARRLRRPLLRRDERVRAELQARR